MPTSCPAARCATPEALPRALIASTAIGVGLGRWDGIALPPGLAKIRIFEIATSVSASLFVRFVENSSLDGYHAPSAYEPACSRSTQTVFNIGLHGLGLCCSSRCGALGYFRPRDQADADSSRDVHHGQPADRGGPNPKRRTANSRYDFASLLAWADSRDAVSMAGHHGNWR